MLRRFADSVLERLLEAFPPDEHHARAAFDRSPMPTAVGRYLTQSLLTRLEVELTSVRNLRSPWIDLDHPEVRAAADTLLVRMAEHARIPADEWQATLERAVRNAISYHARPARTLLDFLFSREDDVYSRSGIERKLAFFHSYPGLSEELDRHFEAQQSDEIDRSGMAALLSRIDRGMADRYDVAAWMQLFRPTFEIASVLSGYENEVPAAIAVAFFRDKGVEPVESALERLHEHNGVETLSPERLKAVLAEAREDRSRSYAVTPEVVEHRSGAEALSEARLPDVPVQKSAGEAAPPASTPAVTDPVPLWKQFQHGPVRPSPGPPPRRAEEAPRARPPAPSTSEGERKPLWMRYAHVEPRASTAPATRTEQVDDLARLEASVLGEAGRDRTLFLRHLFGGSEQDYEAVLLRLSRAEDWPEASQIIAGDVFRRNRVDIYSDAAVAFTNAVESRFEEA